MESSSYRQPYSHRTRFKLVHSTTKLVKVSKVTPVSSQFKLIRAQPKPTPAPAATLPRTKSAERPSSTTLAKTIGNKYKWIRTRNSFKLDRRKTTTTGRVTKRKPRASLSKCLVRIRGVKFQTNPNGKCLQRLTSDSDQSRALSSPIPVKKLERPVRARANVLVQRSIQISNGRYRLRNAAKKATSLRKKRSCIYFNRFGKCHRGDKCPFVHDRSRIAICTQFLNGRCKNASCPYSHELTPGKVPTCSYFIKGACGQDNCPYAHSFVGSDAQVCDDFLQGFCPKGTECSKQHVLLCSQFESTGQCPRGKHCHLTHRRKRTNASNKHQERRAPSLPSIMPAYIPLTPELETKPATVVELKLKPSFLT